MASLNAPNLNRKNGETTMKKPLLTLMLLIWSLSALAAGSRYQIRVDGLACPYCAYGIEKKLHAVKGVENIQVDLNKGLVIVDVTEDTTLSTQQMTDLFHDAGFTYRSMTETAQ